MRDMAHNMPKALATAIGVAFVIGMCVLLIATGGAGADRLGAVDDPLFAAVTATPAAPDSAFMTRLVGAGALVALLGTFFSLAYAGSRQFYHLAQAGFLPPVFGTVNTRQAPAAAVFLVGVIRARHRGISAEQRHGRIHLPHQRFALLCCLRRFCVCGGSEPDLPRTYRALGGTPIAVVGAALVACPSWCPATSSRCVRCRSRSR